MEVDKKVLLYDGGDLRGGCFFSEDPLVVCKVTLCLENLDEVGDELNKLSERIGIAKKLVGEEAMLKLLAVGNASRNALKYLKKSVGGWILS